MLAQKTGAIYFPVNYFRTVLLPYLSKPYLKESFPVFHAKRMCRGNNDVMFSRYNAVQLTDMYRTQTIALWSGVSSCLEKALYDDRPAVFEGYQIEPELLAEFLKCHRGSRQLVRAVFLYKLNNAAILNGLSKGCAETDWILKNTKNPETLKKVAAFITCYSEQIRQAAATYHFTAYNTEVHFRWRIRQAVRHLIRGT
jgi:hypothetical protein